MSNIKHYDKHGNFKGYVPWDHMEQLKDVLVIKKLTLGNKHIYFEDGKEKYIVEWEEVPNVK